MNERTNELHTSYAVVFLCAGSHSHYSVRYESGPLLPGLISMLDNVLSPWRTVTLGDPFVLCLLTMSPQEQHSMSSRCSFSPFSEGGKPLVETTSRVPWRKPHPQVFREVHQRSQEEGEVQDAWEGLCSLGCSEGWQEAGKGLALTSCWGPSLLEASSGCHPAVTSNP